MQLPSDIHLKPVGGPNEFVFSAYVQQTSGFRQPGLDCIVSPFRKPNAAATQHKLSSLYAYLNMASAMAGAAGYDEGILLEPRREGRPILPSITATVVKRLLRHDLPEPVTVHEAELTPQQLCAAEAVILVGTASEVSFVRRLRHGDRECIIGDGTGTPLVRRLIDLYAAFTRGEMGHEDLLVNV